MPGFLDDLLNPAPASGSGTPHQDQPAADSIMETTFAPELFTDDHSDLTALAANAAATLENGLARANHESSYPPPDLKHEDADAAESHVSQYPIEGLNVDNMTVSDAMDIDSQPKSVSPSAEKKPSKARKKNDPEKDNRSSIHSSKNEGQHTDKRYLCYVCNKLFTRRRSVRDHMAKIHGSKAFEPTRSLEITVDPVSGEPVEPLEDTIARGPPSAPEKPAKGPKKEKNAKRETTEPADDDADQQAAAKEADDSVHDFDLGEFPPAQRVGSPAPSAKEQHIEKTPVPDSKPPGRASPQPTPVFAPSTVAGKKRPAPDVSKLLPAAVTKKGTARPKPAGPVAKKPRLAESDSISERSTPLRSPSATPIAAKGGVTSKLKKQVSVHSSPAASRAESMEPASPSPSTVETPGSSNDDGEVFCICRKGDNHTWMIACDGVCNEWYHGKCVNIRERDGDLIDKYICPECTRPDLQTTWKRMCRRQDCRKPAKVLADPPSKYCSKDCGRMFFVELLRRGDPYIDTLKNDQYVVDSARPKKLRKKRKVEKRGRRTVPRLAATLDGDVMEDSESRLATPAYSEDEKSEYETDSSADEDDLMNRGGCLRAGEIRAIADKCKSVEEWRGLGRKPATPPPDEGQEKPPMVFDDFELHKLREIEAQKTENSRRLNILDAKEKLLEAVKTRSAGITDEVKKTNPKWKDLCGFDPRLAWNEDIFVHWYENKGGKEILNSDKPRIGLPEDIRQQENGEKHVNGVQGDSDGEGEDGKVTKKGGVCIRNRCSRHRNWAKAQLAEIRFEQDFVKRNMRQTEELLQGLKDRAVLRALERR